MQGIILGILLVVVFPFAQSQTKNSSWNPKLTEAMKANSIRALSAIERLREVMVPLNHSSVEINLYEIEADKALDEVKISMGSDADKAMYNMIFTYLYQVKLASSRMQLELAKLKSDKKRKPQSDAEITSIYAQFVKDALVCKDETQVVIDAGVLSEASATSRKCLTATNVPHPSPSTAPSEDTLVHPN